MPNRNTFPGMVRDPEPRRPGSINDALVKKRLGVAMAGNAKPEVPAPIQSPAPKAPEPVPAPAPVPAQKSAREKLQEAQELYDSYTQSEEYRQKLVDRGRTLNEKWAAEQTTGAEPVPMPQPDRKEQELKALVEHYQAEADKEENRKILDADMGELGTWEAEDRESLDSYILERDKNFEMALNPMTGAGFMPTYSPHVQALIGKYGQRKVNEMAESITRSRNAGTTEAVAGFAADGVDAGTGSAVLHNALSVPVSAAGGILGTMGYIKDNIMGTRRYASADPNSQGNLANVYAGAVREETAREIAGDGFDAEGNPTDGGIIRKGLSLAYQGAMSIADSYARTILGGGALGGSMLAASNTFASTMSEAARQGATPGEAALLAVTTAGIEAATEYIPLDDLVKAAGSGKQNVKRILTRALKQAGVEATTEELSLFGSVLAEAAILGENADFQQQVNAGVIQGMSVEEASNQAWKGLIMEALETLAVSGIAGAAGSAGASVLGNYRAAREAGNAQVQQPGPNAAKVQQESAAPEGAVPAPAAAQEASPQIPEPLTQEQQTDRALAEAAAKLAEGPRETGKPEISTDAALEQAMAELFQDTKAENAPTEQEIEENIRDRYEYPDDGDAPMPAPGSGPDPRASAGATDPFSGRSFDYEGKRNAFMTENPEVKQLFQREAEKMLTDLADSTRGEKIYNEQLHYDSGGEEGWMGVKRNTSKDIETLLDTFGMKYEQIEKGLKAIASGDDKMMGKSAQKIEFMLNQRLLYGYQDFHSGKRIGPDAEYGRILQGIEQRENDTGRLDSLVAQDAAPPSSDPTYDSRQRQQDAAAEAAMEAIRNGTEGPETKQSRLYKNTQRRAQDEEIQRMGKFVQETRPEDTRYVPQTEREQREERDTRLSGERSTEQERAALMEKSSWSAADNKTAYEVRKWLLKEGRTEDFYALSKKQREINTAAGQVIQSNAEYTRGTPMGAADEAMARLESLGEKGIDPKFYRKTGFDSWAKDVRDTIVELANQIEDSSEKEDLAAMREAVKAMAQFRHTTGWAGYGQDLSRTASAALAKMDFETTKDVALRQLGMIPEDFRKRTKGEILKTIRIQNMLASFKTVNRNLAGNAVQAFADAVSDSYPGRALDMAMAKVTGARTMGNDLARGKEYLKAAREAWNFASLCIELDIPMDSPGAYDFGAKNARGGSSTNTFSMQGGPLSRFFAAYGRAMKYGLEATDKMFEGGAKGATVASLNRLGAKSGLNKEAVASLGDYAGRRRTYKEERKLGKAAGKIKEGLNEAGGAGDLIMPFTGVPSNVAHTGIDYSGMGIVEGLGEMISVMKDAKGMDAMTQEQKNKLILRQRKAASDFGRGLTGASLIALGVTAAAKGAILYTESDDWDEENADLNRFLEGAQINLSALQRIFTGESGDLQDNDILIGMDSLGQFGALFGIASVWAREELSLGEKISGSAMAIFNAVMNTPAMQGISDLQEYMEAFGEAADGDPEAVASAAGTMLGDMASGVYPAFARNAAQAMDPVIRDTSSENPVKAAGNRFQAAMPGMSRGLPAKYDPLTGKEQVRDASTAEAAFNRMFAPDAWHRYSQNETKDFLDQLAEQIGSDAIYPSSKAPASVRYEGADYPIEGKEDTELYQKTYSESVSRLYGELIGNPDFQKLTPERQAEALKEALGTAGDQAKATLAAEKLEGEAAEKAAEAAQEAAQMTGEKITRKAIASTFSDALDAVGEDPEAAAGSLESAWEAIADKNWRWKDEFSYEAGGRVGKYIDARLMGINTETFVQLYQGFKGIDGNSALNTTEKAWQWAHMLESSRKNGVITQKQETHMKGSMKFYQMFPAGAEKFDAMTESGVSADDALDIGTLLQGLKPETGYSSVRDIQKAEAIAGSGLSERDKVAAMKVYLSDSQDENLDLMIALGYGSEEYTLAYKLYSSESGRGKKARTIEKIRAEFGVDYGTAKAIYEVYG